MTIFAQLPSASLITCIRQFLKINLSLYIYPFCWFLWRMLMNTTSVSEPFPVLLMWLSCGGLRTALFRTSLVRSVWLVLRTTAGVSVSPFHMKSVLTQSCHCHLSPGSDTTWLNNLRHRIPKLSEAWCSYLEGTSDCCDVRGIEGWKGRWEWMCMCPAPGTLIISVARKHRGL